MTFVPELETVEDWAYRFVGTRSLVEKLSPPAVPNDWSLDLQPARLSAPGRPPELVVTAHSPRTPRPGALVEPARRAQLLHTFWHHELQAAELMAWALLAFADAEIEFRRGVLRVCLDEIRHMQLYQAHIEHLGWHIGDFPVRDWFWERVPRCATKLSFVALMGMGYEAGNLEHAPHFAAQFRKVGDDAGAALQERVAEEETFHVAFAVEWFTRWTGGCDFEQWCHCLPAPLSPLTLRRQNCNESLRARAGMPRHFVEALRAWVPDGSRPPAAVP